MMNSEQGENGQLVDTNPTAKLLLDAMQPCVARVFEEFFSRETKEGKVDYPNNGLMQQLAKKMFARELDKLSEDAKAALGKTQVDVVRQADSVEVMIDPKGDPDVEKVKDVMLDSLLAPISQIVTLFGCQANVEMKQVPSQPCGDGI